ncbi:hypothetical protein Glove_196g19 [Diversispora epigaea]|uniref:Protein kinase domain-containing protein n=1 Tax=Diversispora epigaea TaxID=1348612 RepID=A0A397IRZ3_9GLOM|nr:hypothetical protein Glove_196g19 [Diversispora epigaea]
MRYWDARVTNRPTFKELFDDGNEEYTKAADVYSFGILAYEMITGFPPYPDIPHDEDLAIKICNGFIPAAQIQNPNAEIPNAEIPNPKSQIPNYN